MDYKLFEASLETIRSASRISLVDEATIHKLKNFKYPKRINYENIFFNLIDSNENAFSPADFDKCNPSLIGSQINWHLISIPNNFQSIPEKEIIHGLMKAVGNCFFAPISYQRDQELDYFFITYQANALKKLFEEKLQINVNNFILPVVVKLGVTGSIEGQSKLIKSILTALSRKVNESPGQLNLSNFAKEREFKHIHISFQNVGTFSVILGHMNGYVSLKKTGSCKVFDFSSNEIEVLEPFSKKLYDICMDVLDLRHNEIKELDEFQHLKELNIRQILLKGNPCCTIAKFEEKLFKILPSLQKIDSVIEPSSIDFNSISKNYLNMNKEIASVGDGDITIKTNNVKTYAKKIFQLLKDNYWTQIILRHNRKFSKKEILDEMASKLLKDCCFFPCYYQRLGDQDEFFLYKNSDAVKVLVDKNLKIHMSRNPHEVIEVTLKLNVAEHKEEELDCFFKINCALVKHIVDNTIDLNAFVNDPEFSKMLVTLRSRSTTAYVLDCLKKINNNIIRIDANDCDISNCEGFGYIFTFPKLTILNLRNNNIQSLDGFKKCSVIKEVFLDGNPLCEKSAVDYVAYVHSYFPQLEWLDGHKVHEENSIISFQNYLICRSTYTVASEFVKQFFTLWDTERSKLTKMYNGSSIFTLSAFFFYDQQITKLPYNLILPRIQAIIKAGRNLMKISNMHQVEANVYYGKSNIGNLFLGLTKTKHDLRSLTIDVPYYNRREGKIIIIVGGFFEDEISLLFGFSRTFVLACANNEFIILNDQLVINSPTQAQRDAYDCAVKIAKEEEISRICRDLMPTISQEKTLKLIMLQDLTECSKNYCQKLLEDSYWDLKVALACFNTYMNNNEVSNDKFNFK